MNENLIQRRVPCVACHTLGRLNNQICPVCKGQGYLYRKYMNVKTEYGGFLFDSKREAEKAAELDILKRAGEVIEWRPHPTYALVPSFRKFGKTFRQITYTPDFYVKWKDGKEEIIDIKGFITEVFRLKHKLFEWRYPEYHLTIEK